MELPVESLADAELTAAEAQQGYKAYIAASSRIVDMFKNAHFNELSECSASSAGSRWASKSVGLGKGSKGNGR